MSAPRLDRVAAQRVLARAGYGAEPGQAATLWQHGLGDWLDAQLALPEDAPPPAPQSERWAVMGDNGRARPPEIERPRLDQQAFTVARKASADAVLRERLIEFWHDHFHVSAVAGAQVWLSLPEHDRRIRAHALGNLRALLEAMATSPAMLLYLSNQSSRAGAPNENFARELLELHTLGEAAYAGGSGHGRAVQRRPDGVTEAYVDGDVWEAARAFAGWSIENGQPVPGGTLPRTGEPVFVASWADVHQKRVLGRDLDPFPPAMGHGRAVLDLLATHPATHAHIAGKLARFLIGTATPAPAAAARCAAALARHAEAPDGIARAVRALLDGPELLSPATGRVRRPLDLVAAGARAYGIPLVPERRLLAAMQDAGGAPNLWPSPDGPPLDAGRYLGASALRARWAMALALAGDTWSTGRSPLLDGLAGLPVAEVTMALSDAAMGPAGVAIARIAADVWARGGRAARPDAEEVGEIAGWVLCAPAAQAT